jgi:hypothetical protein
MHLCAVIISKTIALFHPPGADQAMRKPRIVDLVKGLALPAESIDMSLYPWYHPDIIS